MSRHPEQREGEEFLGNTASGHPQRPHLRQFKTLRRGIQAFDIDGNPLPLAAYSPLFIGHSELGQYNRVITDRCEQIRRGTLSCVPGEDRS